MRKFRVYDNVEQRYVTDEKTFALTSSGKLLVLFSTEETDPNRYIVEYGTGLVDSGNKTEIYEGDILTLTDYAFDPDNPQIYKAKVEFGNPNGNYTWAYQLVFLENKNALTDILAWVEMEDGGAYAEITGNIHEEE